jgi:pyruvate formate lyase activating enzyme
MKSRKEASYYTKLSENRTACVLCPHNCIIQQGKRGICGVRINMEGVLCTEVYGRPVAINTDPIEKKPLYHFYPGHQILSIGTLGCNLKCSFCQNCEISQASGEAQSFKLKKGIKEIILLAREKQRNIGLAYTYNEPVIFYEYMTDLALEVHKYGLKNVMVSNGFINPEPLSQLIKLIDAFNIDLKSFESEFYKKYTRSNLDPVLNTIKTIFASGRHLEITFLVIPGLNDNTDVFDKMIEWIVKETNKKTVLHISRYFPHFHMNLPPPPLKTLEGLYHSAKKKLDFVYLGNAAEIKVQDSYCPVCQTLLLRRNGYYTINEGIDELGSCNKCNEKVINYMTL